MTTAIISDCGLFRYELRRRINPWDGAGTVTFIMLNPSTADALRDDLTGRGVATISWTPTGIRTDSWPPP